MSLSAGAAVYNLGENSVEGHAPALNRSPQVSSKSDSRSPIARGQISNLSGNSILQQRSPPSAVTAAEQRGTFGHVHIAAHASPNQRVVLQALPAAVQQESAKGAEHVPLEYDIPHSKEALVKAALERCRLLEHTVLMQKETITHHESTIASLECDLVDFCAHANASLQESEEAAQRAIKEAKAFREQAAAAEAALASVTYSVSAHASTPLDVSSVSEADARARESTENIQQLQQKLDYQERRHQQQLQSICEAYESRINKLAEGELLHAAPA
jgi:hypothetical protein